MELFRQSFVVPTFAGVILTVAASFAQVPGGQDWKIGPDGIGRHARASDVVVIPIDHHFLGLPSQTHSGWAGFIFNVHVLDSTELDVDSVTPYVYTEGTSGPVQGPGDPVVNPFGPQSENQQSVQLERKILHPAHPNSGVDVANSDTYQAADLQIHVKSTNNPLKNSDTDLVVQLWNIWHFRQGQTSQIVQLQASDRIWVGSNIDGFEDLIHNQESYLELPPTPPIPPMSSQDGHWLHVTTGIPFHFLGSQYYATLVDTITVGIEHVPEPASLVLLVLGLSCAVMGVRSRMRRS